MQSKKPEESRGSGKILYLAQWVWDKYADPLRYRTGKAGTIALTQALANKLAALRINVNCIVPGFIGGLKGLVLDQEIGDEIESQIPFYQMGEMADVMEAVTFLLSNSSKYSTGQVLEVAGGVN